jgi:hypothetical protein
MKKTDLKRLLSNICDALEAAEEADYEFLQLDSEDKNLETIRAAVHDAVVDLEYAKDLIEARLDEEDAAEEDKTEAAA